MTLSSQLIPGGKFRDLSPSSTLSLSKKILISK
jgi:hypothetical protein